jgi:hypothetical protein
MGTLDQAIKAGGIVYMGAAGQVANTVLCVIAEKDPVEFEFTEEKEAVRIQGAELPSRHLVRLTDAKASFNCPVFSPKIAEFILAKTQSGATDTGTVTIGNVTTGAALAPQYSFAFVGNTLDGKGLRVDFPYCSAGNGLKTAMSQEAMSKVPFEVTAEDNTTLRPTIKWNTNADPYVLIATGDLNRVPGLTYAKSETPGAADAVATITANATDLADNEILMVKIWDTDEPITFTHLNDTLELTGDADVVLASLEDWLLLQYDLANTKWVEIGRYVAP